MPGITQAFFAAVFIAMLGFIAPVQAQTPSAGSGGSQPAGQDDSAMEAWASIRNSSDPAKFEDFLQRYPDHAFASFARAKLIALRPQAAAPASQHPPAPQVRQTVAPPPPGTPESIFGGPVAPPPQPIADLASALQLALQEVACYTGGIDGDWGRGSQAALRRFNTLAGSNWPVDAPSQEALAAVSQWRGGNCAIAAKPKAPRTVRKKTASKRVRKKTAAVPKKKAPSGSGMRVIIGGGGVGVGIGF